MSLKIIGGTFRNRTLQTPKGPQTRPTLGILRKCVFDICQSAVEGACFLDLFAGSGAMGIEAISRGASSAVFIDKDRYARSCIQDNIKALQIEAQAEVIGADVMVGLKKLKARGAQFDLIYIDPPYAAAKEGALFKELLHTLETYNLIKSGAYVFTEEASPARLKPETLELEKLGFVNSRTFSQSVLHQFRCKALD